uniref:uncharacterized protein C3orf38 homolog n=1 Tax=Myodes glareolus TaxID=447135 RepID=UPI00202249F7|nr:uncharacterized protein C3orf38 homolog [Myodes glareolus]
MDRRFVKDELSRRVRSRGVGASHGGAAPRVRGRPGTSAVSHEFQKAPEWILVLSFYHPGNERLLLWLFTFHRKHINTSYAIHAILVYSQNVEELLRRKKVHREIIFRYLAAEGVVVPPTTEKHNLIQYAKDYWEKQSPKLKETAEPVTKTEDIQLFQQQAKEDKKSEKIDFRRLGEEFCHWFFELLNSQNPFMGPPQDDWGPQHFWHDVKLRFYYSTSEQNVIDYHGAEIVSLRLLSLVKEEFLFLSPNLDSQGLKCASSPHGLVKVGVAGTVHRGNTCLGIFEQIFGLIRSPFVENTWKIKFINLRIIGGGSLAPGTSLKPTVTFEQSDLEAFYNAVTLCNSTEGRPNVKQTLDSGTGDQVLGSGDEALLNKRELNLPNPLKH